MTILLDWIPIVGMTLLTTINIYIAYITYKVLRISIDLLEETIIKRKETIKVRQISKRVEDKI